jgi:ATP-dependent Clp protease ATP-binding subunit ClpA
MAVLLSEKYLPDKYQPGKALDLLDEACSMVALRRETEVIPKIETENLDEEAAVEEALTHSPVTAYEVTEVVATLLGKTVEQVETELDEE